ncbi:MAG TPA: ABC transporter permease [Gemmatimonadaceae bacterium]|nr:ABC transporter permease [Gemmatimonadaceae bacterium]
MQGMLRDVRYGFRSLVKSPGLSLVATIALTFGIGLTTTMFSIVYGALMKGLPFPDGDRIVDVHRNNPTVGARRMGVPISDYVEYRDQQQTLEAIGAFYTGTVNVSGTGEAERFGGAFVTASVFQVAPVRPVLGRTIRVGEDVAGGPRVAVIGHGMWQRRFGGDPGVIGQILRANGVPFTIVGVMPEGYLFPDDASIWLPLQLDPVATPRGQGQWLSVVGKLKPGVTFDQAALDMDRVARRLQEAYKETNEHIGASVLPFVEAHLGPEPRQLLYTMLGAVFFVLLIACANVANLLLDRAAHRTKEVGIRTALGASRSAVVRQFLTEALLLSAGGAVFGTLLAGVGIGIFNRAIVDSEPPFFIDIALHPPVLLFVIAVSVVATMLSGLIPAYQSSRSDINEVLKDETRGSSSLHIGRMSKALVVFEIALSCGLLVASGLMIKSVTKLRTMDPGFRTANVFTARLGFPSTYTDTMMQRQFHEQLRQRLAVLPGATNATIMSGLPGVGSNGGNFTIDGATYAADRDVPSASWSSVSPGYFETFDVGALRGRVIGESDRADGLPVAVVNQAFADRYFPNEDAIGRRIRRGGRTSEAPWLTIVGVVPTLYSGDPDEPRRPAYYVPLAQSHSNFVSLAVRTTGEPLALTPAVRQAVATLNADIPIYWVYSMEEALARPTWYIRVFGTMFMIFGIIALFLASVGLYAVMSFSVSRRIREVGIRMALGAQGRDVMRMIFRQGAWQLGVGMVLGLALASGVATLMQVILFDVQPRDPSIFGGVAAVLALAGLAACLVPARRATRVDPLVALRAE